MADPSSWPWRGDAPLFHHPTEKGSVPSRTWWHGQRVAATAGEFRTPLVQLPQAVQERREIDLHRVPRRGDVPPPRRGALALYLRTHTGLVRQPYLAAEVAGDEFRLQLSRLHDRTERLVEPDEEQVRNTGRHGVHPEWHVVVAHRQEIVVEERERDLVAGAPDDRVDRLAAAIDETHLPARELADSGLHDHVAVADA